MADAAALLDAVSRDGSSGTYAYGLRSLLFTEAHPDGHLVPQVKANSEQTRGHTNRPSISLTIPPNDNPTDVPSPIPRIIGDPTSGFPSQRPSLSPNRFHLNHGPEGHQVGGSQVGQHARHPALYSPYPTDRLNAFGHVQDRIELARLLSGRNIEHETILHSISDPNPPRSTTFAAAPQYLAPPTHLPLLGSVPHSPNPANLRSTNPVEWAPVDEPPSWSATTSPSNPNHHLQPSPLHHTRTTTLSDTTPHKVLNFNPTSPGEPASFDNHSLAYISFDNLSAPINTSGGFCDLFVGRHPKYGKLALKRPRIRGAFDEEQHTKRFLSECRLWRTLCHPNVLPFIGSYQVHGDLFFVSLYMDEGTILEYMRRRGWPWPTGLVRFAVSFNPPVVISLRSFRIQPMDLHTSTIAKSFTVT